MPTREEKALVMAIEILRDQVSDNTLALAANTPAHRRADVLVRAHGRPDGGRGAGGTRGPLSPADMPPVQGMPVATARSPDGDARCVRGRDRRTGARRREKEEERTRARDRARQMDWAKKSAEPLTRAFGMVTAKLAAIAGPFALLAQVLNSTTSGMQTLGTGTKVLASVFGPIFLPAALLLATEFVAIADVLTSKGMPALQSFFELIVDGCLPGIEMLVQMFQVLADAGSLTASMMKGLGDAMVFVTTLATGRGNESSASAPTALRDVLASFRMSIGPKAQMSGLAEVGKAAQMAALNADPLEMRLMRDQLKVLEKIEAAVAKRRTGRREPAGVRSHPRGRSNAHLARPDPPRPRTRPETGDLTVALTVPPTNANGSLRYYTAPELARIDLKRRRFRRGRPHPRIARPRRRGDAPTVLVRVGRAVRRGAGPGGSRQELQRPRQRRAPADLSPLARYLRRRQWPAVGLHEGVDGPVPVHGNDLGDQLGAGCHAQHRDDPAQRRPEATCTHSAGDGTDTHTWTISTTINEGSDLTVDVPANLVEDADSNGNVVMNGASVDNGSEVSPPIVLTGSGNWTATVTGTITVEIGDRAAWARAVTV